MLSGAQGAGRWATAQQSTARETEIETFKKIIILRSWRKYLEHPEGPRGEVKAEYRHRVTGPGVRAFTRICGWSGLGSWVKARLVNSNQKNGVLVSPTGTLSKGHTRGRLCEVGRLWVTGLLGKSYQKRDVSLCLCRPMFKACACRRGRCQFTVMASRLAKQNGGWGSKTIV